MTHITMDGANCGSNPGFSGRWVRTILMALQSGYGRWRQYRTIEAELRQYSRDELTELGIAPSDIGRVSADHAWGQEYRREDEFRAALDGYIADYQKDHATRVW